MLSFLLSFQNDRLSFGITQFPNASRGISEFRRGLRIFCKVSEEVRSCFRVFFPPLVISRLFILSISTRNSRNPPGNFQSPESSSIYGNIFYGNGEFCFRNKRRSARCGLLPRKRNVSSVPLFCLFLLFRCIGSVFHARSLILSRECIILDLRNSLCIFFSCVYDLSFKFFMLTYMQNSADCVAHTT